MVGRLGRGMNGEPVSPPPGLWEGACPTCTAAYREFTEDWLEAARGLFPSIDYGLQRLFEIHHRDGHE